MKKPAVSDFFIELSTVRMTNEGNLRIRKTASGSGRDTGKTCQSSDISVKSGKVSAGISRKWGSADG